MIGKNRRRLPVRLPDKKQLVIAGGVLLGLFVLINAGTYALYRQRSYPNTTVAGKSLGSVSAKQLDAKIKDLNVLPERITLTHDNKPTTIPLSQLGVSLDTAKTAQRVQRQRNLVPIINFVTAHPIELYLKVDDTAFKKAVSELSPLYTKPATDAAILAGNSGFELRNDTAGYQLDANKMHSTITSAIAHGRTPAPLPTIPIEPKVKATSLQQTLQTLQAQQQASITLRYAGKTAKPTTQQIASWYIIDGPSYKLDDAKIRSFVTQAGNGFGIGVQNAADVVAAIKTTLNNAEPLDVALVAMPTRKTFAYCVALKGVDAGSLAAFRNKLKAVYADTRGWSLGGQVGFAEAASGCNFTVWLTAAPQMTSFGPGCDTTWSCNVGPNVIINFDRWTNASPAWNQGGGSLDDYRSMVINHETGHWLGFGHSYCPGAGQPAPVMQQQSINLQGCSFNPWPTATEQATLRSKLGL